MRYTFFLLGLCICLEAFTQAAKPISATVKMYQGRPTIYINNQPEYAMIYSLTDVPGGRWTWEELPKYNMKSFCNLNIKLIQVDLAFDHVWKEDGTIVLDTAQRQLRGILDVCKDAAIFIRFHVNPPKWWQKKFPQENTVYADREAKPDIPWGLQRIIEDDEETPARFSLASEKWKTESTEKLIEFLRLLKDLPESNSLAGIQVASGVYGEWHYWGFIENEPDMSQPMKLYFKKWLADKYKSDYALQTAWSNKSATLGSATLPTLAERRGTKAGIFRDPLTERNVIDYFEAQHQLVADDILHFCRVVKENWPRPIITGAFYGYFYSLFGRDVVGGHLELQRVLKSPYIDYLSGPGTYYPKAVEMGDPYRSRSLINSVTLHEKLWLDEMDQQSPLLPLKDKNFSVSVEKSVAQVRRNVMFTMSKGQGLWFYDFGPSGFNGGNRLNDHGSFGWWDEPAVREDIKALKALGDAQIHKPYKSDADVLVVHDTESFYYMGSDKKYTAMTHWGNNWPPVGIFKSGVVHDVIHLSDLDKIDLGPYKAIVFLNTFLLRKDQKKMIHDKVARGNRNLIWIYAPGYTNGVKLDVRHLAEVTGIQSAIVYPTDTVALTVDANIVPDYSFSVMNSVINPLFIVTDREAESHGLIKGTKQVGFASKTLAQSTSWFIALPPENPIVWRYIFQKAGAHIYNDQGDVFYSGGGLLSIHTKDGGGRTIKLKNGRDVELKLSSNSTTIVNADTGDLILE